MILILIRFFSTTMYNTCIVMVKLYCGENLTTAEKINDVLKVNNNFNIDHTHFMCSYMAVVFKILF